jgi:hypothetical protein
MGKMENAQEVLPQWRDMVGAIHQADDLTIIH